MASDCLFCRIVEGVIPVERLAEDAQSMAFADINPQAPTHLLIIPKRHLGSLAEARSHDAGLLGHLLASAAELAALHELGKGYRIVVNTGDHAGQTVQHLHLHLLGGRHMAWPPG